jgi:hypothetical protein
VPDLAASGTQPWRCLWRASVLQMTMTRPCRRMTRQLLQIRLTLGLTFTVCLNSQNGRDIPAPLLVAVDDSPPGEVVRRELDDDSVLGKDADVVLPHLA